MSFHHDGPLDMRLDRSSGATAAELLARLSERDLADLIWQYGEERYSRRVAKRIVQTRDMMPITTTRQLAELVRACVPRGRERIDPATRTFQALRIAVNDELAVLEIFLAGLPRLVKPGGRVGIISFHSLEDRLVKRAFRDATVWEVRTKKPLVPSDDEMRDNPRSRSAKLRVAARRG
jgi:16S rRNA (cytosine1402-N4)-methyltransferase